MSKYDLNLHEPLSAAQIAALLEMRAVAEALRPEQIHQGDWHTDGPTDPPDEDTVMCLSCWYAHSPAGQARGLALNEDGIPVHTVEALADYRALEHATGLPDALVVALLGYERSTLVGLFDEGEDALDQRKLMLDRLDFIVTRTPGRRTLSSRP